MNGTLVRLFTIRSNYHHTKTKPDLLLTEL
jgi:hypothetical protein